MLVAFIVITVANTSPFATDCPTLLSAMAWVLGASLSLTTLLFFCRVRAVYLDNKWVIRFFFLLWLGVVAGCITSSSGVAKDEPTDGSPCCISDPTIRYPLSPFIAVTWRILQNSLVETNFRNGFRVIIFGRYLPAFSKALLKDGQIYFLTTVSLAIVATATFYSPGVSPLVSVAFAFPNVAMMNLMGSQIYRNTRLSSGQRPGPQQKFQ
ncbi:hypothetical protein CPB84DRAFT_1781151 [Gymnopilus junonius]|uniref:Uncharacterized protein n=1 Tax=Gymnopilus junonius TaxID=109634 RepID=A0A9P5NJ86_GYMJU|nr:hypothetical protein CPB84DRAFT_1781151 [Gymnopilus junonius]